jgi:predicted small metal-binding protein
MKKITCREISGTCDKEIEANSSKEMIKKCQKHLRIFHPEIADEIERDDTGWIQLIESKWNKKPDA